MYVHFDNYQFESFNQNSIKFGEDYTGEYSRELVLDDLISQDKQSFERFFQYFEIEDKSLGNIRVSGFKVTAFYMPIICKNEETGQIGLSWQRQFYPVEKTANGMTINGQSIFFDSYTIKLKEGNQWVDFDQPIIAFAPDDCEEVYAIRVLADKEAYNVAKYKKAISSNNLDAIVPMIAPIGSGLYASISYLFTEYFTLNKFLETGIAIEVTGVKFTNGEYGRSMIALIQPINITGTTVAGKEKMVVPIKDITGIFFGNTHDAFKSVSAVPENQQPSKTHPWWLWVIGQGLKPDTVPNHLIVNRIVPPIQAALDAQKALEPVLKSADPGFTIDVKSKKELTSK